LIYFFVFDHFNYFDKGDVLFGNKDIFQATEKVEENILHRAPINLFVGVHNEVDRAGLSGGPLLKIIADYLDFNI